MGNFKNNKVFLAVLVVLILGVSGYGLKTHLGAAARGTTVTSGDQGEPGSGGLEPAQGAGPAHTTGNTQGTGPAAAGAGGKATGEDPTGATTTTGGLSNNRHGWGLMRNNTHQPPEMPSSITAVLNKYGAYWIGGPKEKVVYLTFDEGYENGYTARILDTLKANDVKAAFFVTGHYLKTQPDLVRRMVNEGHIVGNHTDTHPSLPDVSDEQIKKELQVVEQKFEEITGRKGMKYLRPPKGEYSERTLALTRELGYHNVFWSLALVDWVPMPGGPQEAYQSVMDNLHNGALVLLHAVSKDNTEAMDRILKDTKAQGYTFKTLDDLTTGN